MIKRFEAAAKTEKGKKLAAALWEERMQNCYPVVVSVAREAGLEDWSCPAIAKVCTVPVE